MMFSTYSSGPGRPGLEPDEEGKVKKSIVSFNDQEHCSQFVILWYCLQGWRFMEFHQYFTFSGGNIAKEMEEAGHSVNAF